MDNAVRSAYEVEREMNIQRNRAVLVELGLADEVCLQSKRPRPVRRHDVLSTERSLPARRSPRFRVRALEEQVEQLTQEKVELQRAKRFGPPQASVARSTTTVRTQTLTLTVTCPLHLPNRLLTSPSY